MKEKIPIGNDHAGFELKHFLMPVLTQEGFEVMDMGTFSDSSADYPDFIHPLACAVEKQQFKRGIVLCGSGNGAAMVANKYPHVRAALCWTEEIAKLARLHNNANVLAIPARFVFPQEAIAIMKAFLYTSFEGGRHSRRVDKISALIL